MKRTLKLDLLVLPLLLVLFGAWKGCSTPIEVSARDGIAGAKAVLDSYKAEYKCSMIDADAAACSKLSQATAIKDLAIDSLVLYCSGPNFDMGGGKCQPSADPNMQKTAMFKLQAALANLNLVISDVKQSLGGGKK